MVNFYLGTGWEPDETDERDFTRAHPEVAEPLQRAGIANYLDDKVRQPTLVDAPANEATPELPDRVDFSDRCLGVHFQGTFNTCSAHVAAAILELVEARAFGEAVDASRMFIYKVTKNFLGKEGDVGLYIRQAMGAIRLIGAPPEKYWPYPEVGKFADHVAGHPPAVSPQAKARLDEEPPAFCYALANAYKTVKSYRLDDVNNKSRAAYAALITEVKTHLAADIPTSIGFPLYSSAIAESIETGDLPLPKKDEPAIGRHAVVTVGYDDNRVIVNSEGEKSKGALLVHNSWSGDWGNKGHGWIPYDYVMRGYTRDFWTVTNMDYVETNRFQLTLR